MAGFRRAAVFLLAACFVLVLFLSNFRLLVFNESYYDSEFRKLGVYDEYPEAGVISGNIIGFFKGNEDLSEAFSEREAKHLFDVKELINKSLLFFYFAFLIEIFLFTLFFALDKKSFLDVFVKTVVYGSSLVLVLSAVLFIFSFSSLFSSFHSLFFAEGTWLFPSESVLISVFPEKFFYDFFFRVAFYSCVESFLAVLFCFFAKERKKIKKFLNEKIQRKI